MNEKSMIWKWLDNIVGISGIALICYGGVTMWNDRNAPVLIKISLRCGNVVQEFYTTNRTYVSYRGTNTITLKTDYGYWTLGDTRTVISTNRWSL
jgi:hypothetical protein